MSEGKRGFPGLGFARKMASPQKIVQLPRHTGPETYIKLVRESVSLAACAEGAVKSDILLHQQPNLALIQSAS